MSLIERSGRANLTEMFMNTRSLVKNALIVMFSGWIWGRIDAADQDLFDIYQLEIEGEIHDFLCGDIDGDGPADIVIVYSPYDDYSTRYLGLYLQRKDTGFNIRPDYLVPISLAAAQMNLADLDQDGRSEIVIMDSEGVSALKFSKSAGLSDPIAIIRQKTIFSSPVYHGIMVDPFVFEINNQPGPEIIIPAAKGYAIYERGDKGAYQILNQIEVPILDCNHVKSIQDLAGRGKPCLSMNFPAIRVIDGNLDGRNDLYLLWDRRFCCFFQDATGNFPQTPDNQNEFYTAHTKGYFQSCLEDFNGDGRPDVAVSYTSGGITNTETRVRFYMADANGRVSPNFVKEIVLSNSHCNLLIQDYDNDRNPEMVIPAVEVGSLAATKIFLMKKADLHLLVYTFKDGIPSDEPSERFKYEFRLNLDDPYPMGEVALDWSADFNGDGLNDLVFSDGNGKIKFFWGKRPGFLSSKPDLEIPADHPYEIHPVKLEKGKFSGAIIRHCLNGRIDRLTVMKNNNH
jgi:hypothetical protein